MTGENVKMSDDIEIERQFRLLRPASEIVEQAIRDGSCLMSYHIEQSYLPDTGLWTIRARKTIFGERIPSAFEQTLKRARGGIERTEKKLELTEAGYRSLLAACGPTLFKRRSEISLGERIWEIDVFLNPELQGLELVEVELPSSDTALVLPDWVGEETTHMPEFRNARLAERLATNRETLQ